jgi:hypothetical protein
LLPDSLRDECEKGGKMTTPPGGPGWCTEPREWPDDDVDDDDIMDAEDPEDAPRPRAIALEAPAPIRDARSTMTPSEERA